MIQACQGQLRVGMGGPFALDYGAIIQTATLAGPMSAEMGLLLSECLPEVERAVIASMRKDDA